LSLNTKSHARIELLQQLEEDSPSPRRHPVWILGQRRDLKVFSVDNTIPKFRLENGRIASQIEELRSDPNNAEILKDPGDDRAQDLIQKQLLELIKEAGLERILVASGVQEEPLLLSYDGFVVNGNRRLAVLRKRNIGGGYVDVCVLPKSVTKDEIQLIELRLQMDNPGKSEYSWVNQLLTIRNNLDTGIPKEKLQSAMPSLSKAAFDALHHSLEVIDMFLERRGTPRRYGEIGNQKYFFDELSKGFKKHQRFPEKVDALMWMAVNYFDHETTDGNEDRAFRKLGKAVKQVGMIQQRFGSPPDMTASPDDPNDPLRDIAPSGSVFRTLSTKDPETAEKIHQVVLDGEDKDARSKNASQLFTDLSAIAKKIVNAEIDERTANIAGILQQLKLIEDRAADLRTAAVKTQKQSR